MKKAFCRKNSITKKQLRESIREFAKGQGVNKITFANKGIYVKGTYNAVTGSLFVDLKQTKREMLITFFHEMGHHVAVKKNKWHKYHYSDCIEMSSETIFEIENKIDQIGEKLWYKYVDTKHWGKYKYSYPRLHKKTIIRDFINKQ